MKNVKIQEQGNNEFLPIYNFNISDNNILNSDFIKIIQILISVNKMNIFKLLCKNII